MPQLPLLTSDYFEILIVLSHRVRSCQVYMCVFIILRYNEMKCLLRPLYRGCIHLTPGFTSRYKYTNISLFESVKTSLLDFDTIVL
jgi:hypothetical protein